MRSVPETRLMLSSQSTLIIGCQRVNPCAFFLKVILLFPLPPRSVLFSWWNLLISQGPAPHLLCSDKPSDPGVKVRYVSWSTHTVIPLFFFTIVLVEFSIQRLGFFVIDFLVNIGFPKIESGWDLPPGFWLVMFGVNLLETQCRPCCSIDRPVDNPFGMPIKH